MKQAIESKAPRLQDASERPARLSELSSGEQLVIWSFRRWVSGSEHWNVVWHEYNNLFRDDAARDTLAAFVRLVNLIACNACRRVQHHHPCCPCLTEDEVTLCSMVGAAQDSNTNMVRHYARTLVAKGKVEDLVIRSVVFAQHLSNNSITVSQKSHSAPRRVHLSKRSFPHTAASGVTIH